MKTKEALKKMCPIISYRLVASAGTHTYLHDIVKCKADDCMMWKPVETAHVFDEGNCTLAYPTITMQH